MSGERKWEDSVYGTSRRGRRKDTSLLASFDGPGATGTQTPRTAKRKTSRPSLSDKVGLVSSRNQTLARQHEGTLKQPSSFRNYNNLCTPPTSSKANDARTGFTIAPWSKLSPPAPIPAIHWLIASDRFRKTAQLPDGEPSRVHGTDHLERGIAV